MKKVYFLLVLLCVGYIVHGQQNVSAKDRSDVLDILRESMRDSINQSVKFKVLFINNNNNWILIHAHPLLENGDEPKYSNDKTLTGAEYNVCALFQLKDGQWRQRECAITFYDVPDAELLRKHGLQQSGLAHIPPPYTTKVTGDERTAILDGLRARVDKDIHIAAKFQVQSMHRCNDWVMISAVPRQMSGQAIDYRKTHYKEQLENEAFDDQVVALLNRQNGVWKVIEYTLGATDYSGDYWLQLYGLKGCEGMD